VTIGEVDEFGLFRENAEEGRAAVVRTPEGAPRDRDHGRRRADQLPSLGQRSTATGPVARGCAERAHVGHRRAGVEQAPGGDRPTGARSVGLARGSGLLAGPQCRGGGRGPRRRGVPLPNGRGHVARRSYRHPTGRRTPRARRPAHRRRRDTRGGRAQVRADRRIRAGAGVVRLLRRTPRPHRALQPRPVRSTRCVAGSCTTRSRSPTDGGRGATTGCGHRRESCASPISGTTSRDCAPTRCSSSAACPGWSRRTTWPSSDAASRVSRSRSSPVQVTPCRATSRCDWRS
jgi:hypothetical protein